MFPGSGLSYECGKSSLLSMDVQLKGPEHPVGKQNILFIFLNPFSLSKEITSPSYPNTFNSTGLDCSWDIRALHGAKVKITVIEADLDEGCFDNTLTLLDDTPQHQNSSLKYPGVSAHCGQSTLPGSGKSLISDGVVTVKFHSLTNNHGHVRFKLLLEATSPEYCISNTVEDKCPDGPCCQGKDCCVYHAGSVPKGINKQTKMTI